jgi:hypothetical protein
MTKILPEEQQDHRDLVALLDAQRVNGQVCELLRLQKLVDDGLFETATASVEVDMTYDVSVDSVLAELAGETTAEDLERKISSAARSLAHGRPVDVTLVTMTGPRHWPVVRFEGSPGEIAIITARVLAAGGEVN